MKIVYLILVIFFIMVEESNGQRQAGNNDYITVDVRRSYSSKKELILQDFMDVEYIALETNDDFLNQGLVQDIGKEFIVVRNRIDDGNIYVYDRQGKALRNFNHKGPGPGEYIFFYSITLDEDREEIFVNDILARKIIVYDLYGNFKRNLNISSFYTDIFNYDKDNLICYDEYNKAIAFVLISKQDGSITTEIRTPFKEKKLLRQSNVDITAGPGLYRPITPYKGNWILLEFSTDTVFTFLPDYSLRPFIVRTPSIQSMDPEVMLRTRLLSDRYYFMDAVRNEYNFNTRSGFSTTYFIYDTQEKAFSGYTLYNGDYLTKKELYMSMLRPVNHEIDSWQPLEAYQLVESYKKGELKDGKLKEIAAKLDPDDNPVIMLVKHKR